MASVPKKRGKGSASARARVHSAASEVATFWRSKRSAGRRAATAGAGHTGRPPRSPPLLGSPAPSSVAANL
ncbi:MAG: hypothetical protein BJ554DRAFT_815 [Olpidium bornovanus]|uniref:Uncharacterized protein n=1 Tax=Olpidium bornovanus TaxID=278681 RepID=A0A8H7ZSZ9_9FUNG|nr:MAG: hypothetical protein BJ554DRAFT_815 [Olpidium bornovanus]